MSLKSSVAAAFTVVVLGARPAVAQTATTEIDLTAGPCVAGATRLFAGASAGVASDMDAYARRSELDSTLRLRGASGRR